MPNLYGKEFVFLFDDSGSMRNTDQGARMSRWLELKEFAGSKLTYNSRCDRTKLCVRPGWSRCLLFKQTQGRTCQTHQPATASV